MTAYGSARNSGARGSKDSSTGHPGAAPAWVIGFWRMLPMMALRLPWRRGWSRLRVRGQQDCGPGRLAEVEVRGQVAEDARVLADVGSRVGTAVRRGIQPGPAEEVVLDELVVRVEGQRLVVDVPRPGVRADDQGGHPEPVAVLVDPGRDHMVVEAAPVVPGQEDRGGIPVGAFHDGIDEVGDVGLAGGEVRRRVIAVGLGGSDPGDRGQGALPGRGVEGRQVLDVAELAVLFYVGERRQRVPDRRGL